MNGRTLVCSKSGVGVDDSGFGRQHRGELHDRIVTSSEEATQPTRPASADSSRGKCAPLMIRQSTFVMDLFGQKAKTARGGGRRGRKDGRRRGRARSDAIIRV